MIAWLTVAAILVPGIAVVVAPLVRKRPSKPALAVDPYPPEAAEAPDDMPPVQRAQEWTGDTDTRVDTVEQPIAFGVLGESGYKRAILRYSTSDPVAVGIWFVRDNHGWCFARELLHSAAIDRLPAGIADVQIFERDACMVVIGLSSPDGEISLTADVVELVTFLRATYALVPRGKEQVDVDGLLSALLNEEAR
jgi:hypothetical protein